jgi:hypothetical protein
MTTPQLEASGLIVSERTVRSKPEHVDEVGEGAEREAAGQNEADGKPGLAGQPS